MFHKITSELILSAVESTGLRATGRIIQLNSMENRVYAVDVEHDGPRAKQVIAKFYRPKRWTVDQILSEHMLQIVLSEENIQTPKFIPITKSSFQTKGTVEFSERLQPEFAERIEEVKTLGHVGDFHFCIWEKISGRSPLELSDKNLIEIGTTIARMHNLFESCIHPNGFQRHALSTQFLGTTALHHLKAWGKIPNPIDGHLYTVIEELIKGLQWINTCQDFIPTHGDLHRLNLIQTQDDGNFWVVDFDDCMWAPDVQDLWLIASGCHMPSTETESSTEVAFRYLKEGYTGFRKLPLGSEDLIEPLRTLRMIYYIGWIAGRWNDPLFRETFTFFPEVTYWEKTFHDLLEQKQILQQKGLLGDA